MTNLLVLLMDQQEGYGCSLERVTIKAKSIGWSDQLLAAASLMPRLRILELVGEKAPGNSGCTYNEHSFTVEPGRFPLLQQLSLRVCKTPLAQLKQLKQLATRQPPVPHMNVCAHIVF